ncbi:hypothetical protein VTN02DRAFT_290 [Thermoascus thermophilus]
MLLCVSALIRPRRGQQRTGVWTTQPIRAGRAPSRHPPARPLDRRFLRRATLGCLASAVLPTSSRSHLYDGMEQFASDNMICGSVCESADTRPKTFPLQLVLSPFLEARADLGSLCSHSGRLRAGQRRALGWSEHAPQIPCLGWRGPMPEIRGLWRCAA